ncbi:hypothetical protein PROFUN_00020 [Planoprotostelium fungivorum]|uniref:Uncharacterized protein n=1 Tax=Planoprotostelium fungivorum TaxID=1890364 RepID=A0A2P6P0G7_9EUKA|nr:hypothetical protein PROFUN_00020 [Planoprotostelium fungivorum]
MEDAIDVVDHEEDPILLEENVTYTMLGVHSDEDVTDDDVHEPGYEAVLSDFEDDFEACAEVASEMQVREDIHILGIEDGRITEGGLPNAVVSVLLGHIREESENIDSLVQNQLDQTPQHTSPPEVPHVLKNPQLRAAYERDMEALRSSKRTSQKDDELTKEAMRKFDENYKREVEGPKKMEGAMKKEGAGEDEISEAMKGFKLSYTPSWAANITEEQWTDVVKKSRASVAEGL